MNFLKLLTIGVRKGRIATIPDLIAAIGEGAAFLAQGSSYAYLRARTGTMGPRLMQDAAFGAAMERCKWEGFAAMAGDLVLILETDLRPLVSVGETELGDLYARVLEAQDLPAHRAARGWDDRIAGFDGRLARHLEAPGRGIAEICAHGANVLMDEIPVEDAIREADRAMVVNNVAFRFIDHVGDLRRRMDLPALAAALAAYSSPGTP